MKGSGSACTAHPPQAAVTLRGLSGLRCCSPLETTCTSAHPPHPVLAEAEANSGFYLVELNEDEECNRSHVSYPLSRAALCVARQKRLRIGFQGGRHG